MQFNRKGQGIVEFAIVLLPFIFFFIGGYLVFIFCYDYMTLATTAREDVRQLSVCAADTSGSDSAMLTTAKSMITKNKPALSSNYVWDPVGVTDGPDATTSGVTSPFILIRPSRQTNAADKGKSVTVVLTASRGQGGLTNMLGILPATITASSTMYWEGASQ